VEREKDAAGIVAFRASAVNAELDKDIESMCAAIRYSDLFRI
jgi:hypothetical protein